MTGAHRGRKEGVHRDEAGTVDAEGFIAPSVGLVEHALYFTSAPDVLAKTKQVIDQSRLELPGAVVVWDETAGRRTGAKAVPGAWWSGRGSLTMCLAFPARPGRDLAAMRRDTVSAVLAAIDSFSPSAPVSCDSGGIFMLGGGRVGMIHHETHGSAELVVLRVNACTDYSKAPGTVRQGNSRLIDYIDAKRLPLGDPRTLPNTLALAFMTIIPERISAHRAA